MQHIKEVRINSFLQINELVVESGKLVVFEGGNGTGKTSAIKAIANVFEGGGEASLIRHGAEEADTILVLDDDSTYKKTIRPTGTSLTLKDAKGRTIGQPKVTLDSLTNNISINPAKLMGSDKKDAKTRVDYVLKATSVEMDPRDIQKVAGIELERADTTWHPLQWLEAYTADVYAKRRAARSIMDDKEASVREMRARLPEQGEIVDEDAIRNLRVEYGALVDKGLTLSRAITDQRTTEDRVDRETFNDGILAGERNLSDAIQKLKDEWSERRQRAETKITERAAAREASANDAIAEIEHEMDPQVTAAQIEITRAEERLKTFNENKGMRDLIDIEQQKSVDLRAKWSDLESRMKKLDEMKGALTAKIPIPGLEIVDGDLALDGFPWAHVNGQRKIQTAFQLARLNSGELGFMFFDGLEQLDPDHLFIFLAEAVQCEQQVFATRVTEGPMVVKTERDYAFAEKHPLDSLAKSIMERGLPYPDPIGDDPIYQTENFHDRFIQKPSKDAVVLPPSAIDAAVDLAVATAVKGIKRRTRLKKMEGGVPHPSFATTDVTPVGPMEMPGPPTPDAYSGREANPSDSSDSMDSIW